MWEASFSQFRVALNAYFHTIQVWTLWTWWNAWDISSLVTSLVRNLTKQHGVSAKEATVA